MSFLRRRSSSPPPPPDAPRVVIVGGGFAGLQAAKALREAPVESWRYLPTTPLELARPLGCWADLELSSSRADSQALAARITILPFTW